MVEKSVFLACRTGMYRTNPTDYTVNTKPSCAPNPKSLQCKLLGLKGSPPPIGFFPESCGGLMHSHVEVGVVCSLRCGDTWVYVLSATVLLCPRGYQTCVRGITAPQTRKDGNVRNNFYARSVFWPPQASNYVVVTMRRKNSSYSRSRPSREDLQDFVRTTIDVSGMLPTCKNIVPGGLFLALREVESISTVYLDLMSATTAR